MTHPWAGRLLGVAPPRSPTEGFLTRTEASGPAAGRLGRGLASVALAGGLTTWIAIQSGHLGGVVGLLGALAVIGLVLCQLGFLGVAASSAGLLGLAYILADTSGHHLASWTAIPFGVGAFVAAELATWAAERRVGMVTQGRGGDTARLLHLATVAALGAAIGGAILAAAGAVHGGGLALEAGGLVAAVGVVAVMAVLTARARSGAAS